MKTWTTLGATSMAIAVALGAFGTHALRATFDDKQLEWWATAQQYQVWHALGLILVGVIASTTKKNLTATGIMFSIGTVLFSGSLYLMALTKMTWLGAITPLGGAAFIAGWIALALTLRGKA